MSHANGSDNQDRQINKTADPDMNLQIWLNY